MRPKPSQCKTARAIQACLKYLHVEAEEEELFEVAHIIGLAALAASDAARPRPASDERAAPEQLGDEAQSPVAALR